MRESTAYDAVVGLRSFMQDLVSKIELIRVSRDPIDLCPGRRGVLGYLPTAAKDTLSSCSMRLHALAGIFLFVGMAQIVGGKMLQK